MMIQEPLASYIVSSKAHFFKETRYFCVHFLGGISMKPYLMQCPLCNGSMSSAASACPHCGQPNDLLSSPAVAPVQPAKKEKKKYTKRPDGRYETMISTGKYDPDTGKLITVRVYGRTMAELEDNKALVKADLTRGTYANDKGYTVGEWADKWLETYKSNKGGYDNIIRNHLGDLKDIRLKDLTKSDIQKQIKSLEGHYDLQRRLKLTINQMIEVAIDDGLLYKNVCRNVELPSKPKTNKRALYEYELSAIRKAEFEPHEKAFISCLYYLGIRRGEALALRKDDFDFKKNYVHISRAVSFYNNASTLKDPKSLAGDRYIDIVEPFLSEIRSYIQTLDGIFLFSSRRSQSLMTPTGYKRFWQGIYRKINAAAGGNQKFDTKKNKWEIIIDAVPGLTPHIFRHNYATNLYYAGVDLKEAQRLLGHADAKTTIEIYTHLDKKKSKSTTKIKKLYQREVI